jgi:hypothetical protein
MVVTQEVLEHCVIVVTCIRCTDFHSFLVFRFQDFFGFHPTDHLHIFVRAKSQLNEECPTLSKDTKINVRLLGRDPTPVQGWERDSDRHDLSYPSEWTTLNFSSGHSNSST